MASALMAETFCSAPRQTLPLRLRRRGSRACPARHGARPAPRLAGPSRPTLGPSALAGRRLATAVAGLRKASELFKLSCAYDSCNTPVALRGNKYFIYASIKVLPCTRIKPSVKSPKSGILVTEVITFDKIAPWVILGRSCPLRGASVPWSEPRVGGTWTCAEVVCTAHGSCDVVACTHKHTCRYFRH